MDFSLCSLTANTSTCTRTLAVEKREGDRGKDTALMQNKRHSYTYTFLPSSSSLSLPTDAHTHTRTQAGTSICRVIPALTRSGTRVTDVFETVRPHMELTVDNILSHINTVFVLRTKVDKYSSSSLTFTPAATGAAASPASTGSLCSSKVASSKESTDQQQQQQQRRPASPTSEHSK